MFRSSTTSVMAYVLNKRFPKFISRLAPQAHFTKKAKTITSKSLTIAALCQSGRLEIRSISTGPPLHDNIHPVDYFVFNIYYIFIAIFSHVESLYSYSSYVKT
ncbi:hypothetical protein NECAME_07871 [Necator americanus]|uniref:Uncharacterized protein n=1 Tax=Necator americanus TaxID=51031 RepID=W2TLS5_NECAM|nr:hypothetical protein NECAME_07871 [Necator americanus]ETN82579.1 hypothetical protein NECAME_07871 [Necator americanus]